jgi:hypothetical protein
MLKIAYDTIYYFRYIKNNMMINLVKITCTICFLTSCTSYVWDPVNYVEFETILNEQIGKDFTQTYPRSSNDNLINENEVFAEYIQDEYADCSWIVKVEKTSNKIESWRYSYLQRCENYKQQK